MDVFSSKKFKLTFGFKPAQVFDVAAAISKVTKGSFNGLTQLYHLEYGELKHMDEMALYCLKIRCSVNGELVSGVIEEVTLFESAKAMELHKKRFMP